ncbi:MAG: HNH endonuclease, partial [Actinobacteria bacterium]|nr:HNH endonuclease [Actinomycetota bacterium]
IEDRRRHIFEDARRNGTRESYEAYGFDAMIQMFVDVYGGAGGTSTPAPAPAGGLAVPAAGSPTPTPAPAGGAGGGGGGAGGAVDTAFGKRQAPTSTPAPAGGGVHAGGASGAGGAAGGGGAVDTAFGKRQAPTSTPAPAGGAGGLAVPAAGSPTPTPAPASTPTPASRAKIIVRIDHAALIRGHAITGEVSEIAGIGPIAPSAVIDMIESGDPFLAAVVTKGEEVTSVVHLGRRPNAKQQTALQWLYPTCAVKGCQSTAYLEMDHRKPWANTRITVLSLLDRLCSYHHGLKTRENWSLVAGHGKRAFVPPEDPRHPARQRQRQKEKEKNTRTHPGRAAN